MDVDVLFNGEVYVKNGPDLYCMTNDSKDLMRNLESSESFTAKEQLDELKKLKNNEGKDDYSGCRSFWVPFVDENGITMVEQTKYHVAPSLKRCYKNKEVANKSFTKLIDFLDNSRYVGRYFKRTSPILNSNDKSYTVEDEKTLVLYANDDLMLIKNISNYSEEESFEMISPLYFKDNNF